jgi:hypothetical protein
MQVHVLADVQLSAHSLRLRHQLSVLQGDAHRPPQWRQAWGRPSLGRGHRVRVHRCETSLRYSYCLQLCRLSLELSPS